MLITHSLCSLYRWNFTPSPGWTKEEAHLLKLCLMKFGIGRWVQILDTGLLPGKLIQQLNGQTQRLLGQQSLAAYTGLQVDIDRIRADNEARTDAPRKAGLIINTGRTLVFSSFPAVHSIHPPTLIYCMHILCPHRHLPPTLQSKKNSQFDKRSERKDARRSSSKVWTVF